METTHKTAQTAATSDRPQPGYLKQGISFLVWYYSVLVMLSVVYRIVFLLLNHGDENCSLANIADISTHGLIHDLAIAGYFTAIPLLLTIVSGFHRLPLKIFYKFYNALLAFATALAFVADLTLYPYWEHKLDAAAILVYIDSPANATASVTVTHLLLLSAALLVLTLAIYQLLSLICRKEPNSCNAILKRPLLLKVLHSIVFLFMAGLMFLGIRGGVTESTNNVGSVYYSGSTRLNHAAVNPVFSFLYTLANIEDFGNEYTFLNEDECNSIVEPLYGQNAAITDTLLTNTRPNIITIILEGFSACFIEELGGKEDVTPNISRLCKEGVLFTNCYANSFRTDRGVLCTLSGYPSFPKTSVMKDANKSQKLPSLASSLKRVGYTSTFLYGGDANFTNMSGYLYSTGYNRIISDRDFTQQERSTHRWGAGDDITFNRLLSLTKEQKSSPWHITYLTLSSHEPWQVPYSRIADDEKANAFAFTDEQLGFFIDSLKADGQWENTLIICIADHSVVGYPQGIRQTNRERNHILFLLLGGALKGEKQIDKICNQTDMVATILAQLQLPIDDFPFSRNILSPQYTTPFAYHCYNNGVSLIDSTGFSVVDLDSNTIIAGAEDANGERRAKQAKAILQSTYKEYTNL